MKRRRWWLVGTSIVMAAALLPTPYASTSEASGMQLSASAARVTWGDPIRFDGALDSAVVSPDCLAGVEIVIERDAIDDGDFPIEVARARTDEEGIWSAASIAEESSSYWATTVPETGSGCPENLSNTVRVDVRLKVDIERSAKAVRSGRTVRIRVQVLPQCPYQANGDIAKIPLFALRGGRFVKVDAKRDPYDCTVTFERRIRHRSVFSSRVRRIDVSGAFYLGGRSKELGVDVLTRTR